MQRYPILHSGYISALDTHLTKTDYNANPFVENVLFRQSGTNTFANLFYNKEITELFKRFEADRNLMRNFEFRESIIVMASRLFGKAGLTAWIDNQARYAKLTYSHSGFLLDTLLYLATGKRDMSVATWQTLVKNSSNGENSESSRLAGVEQLVKQYGQKLEGTTTEIICQWVGYKGGHEDLLYTLWIIFGDKSYPHHSVVQKTGA